MRLIRWLCAGVACAVWSVGASASWDPRPVEADGTVVSACHYSDATRFAVTGTGTDESGNELAGGHFEYTFAGAISTAQIRHCRRFPGSVTSQA